MRSTHRVGWGMAASALLHAALLLALVRAPEAPALDQRPSRVLSVALLPASDNPGPSSAALPETAPEPAETALIGTAPLDDVPAQPPSPAAERTDIYYYFPEELERQLIVLRDRSGDYDIALAQEVVMHLFVDLHGKVVSIAFEGEPTPAVQEQVRAAFMTMEFMPGLRQGQPVPSRIKIGIAATPALDTKVY